MRIETNRLKTIGIWVLSGLVALAFTGAGLMKVSGNEEMVNNFARWGFPAFFVTFVGIAELAGALGVLVPRLRFAAATGLTALMAGATGTHLVYGEVAHSGPAVILLVVTTVLAWIHRPDYLRSGKSEPTPA
jgi:uncharacterized membrane protein YphA (DoxX/SURF4 family)